MPQDIFKALCVKMFIFLLPTDLAAYLTDAERPSVRP